MKKVMLCDIEGSVVGEFESDVDFQSGDVITFGETGTELWRVLDRVFSISKPKEVVLICFAPSENNDLDNSDIEAYRKALGQVSA